MNSYMVGQRRLLLEGEHALPSSPFSYPRHDEDAYLTWFRDQFSSVFIATNPFLHVPGYTLNLPGDWVPNEVLNFAKRHGEQCGVSWQEMAKLCSFRSIAHVNRALRLTGSKRVLTHLASPSDTALMLQKCNDQNIFMPDEGRISPLVELSIGHFLKKLGHDQVVVADHFGNSPRKLGLAEFLNSELIEGVAEIYTEDRSIYISIYTDYHYILVCQTNASHSVANPEHYFEGFSADLNTSNLWGIGDMGQILA